MATPQQLHILSAERIDGTELLVEFSDRTIARFTPDQLAALQPDRPPTEGPIRGDVAPPPEG